MRQGQTAGQTPPSDQHDWRTAPADLGRNSFHILSRREGNDVAKACLNASYLLRRFVHRQLGMPETSRAVSLATCHLLDALSRALNDNPHCVPPPVATAALRLSERIADLPPTPYLTPRTRPRDVPG